ncbi:class I SAM-dependent methyltransferase [Paracoccus sp. p3-h83]|uniref:class I SAM-dependent methyltransferase n=1 Tax=Paracoccus sp. p3-h83 TaxID=3342805 RepID=UPI0035BB4FB7
MTTRANPRLVLAADEGIPDGRIAVIGADAATELPQVPGSLHMIAPFRPDHDAFVARGLPVAAQPEGDYAGAFVLLPRARDAGRARLVEAMARVVPGGPVWVDGAKTDGVDTMLRDLRDLGLAVGDPIAKAHGKIARLVAGPGLPADWAAADLHPAPGFVTRPGVFSADGVDRGSALLAAALPPKLPGRVADLGAGWGWLSAQALTRPGIDTIDLIEADAIALDCARRNITDPRARFHWADATRFEPEARYGAILMNPPFHQGRAADPSLGLAFIAAAARMLSLSGALYLVANRHLPYESALTAAFREVDEIGGDGAFKVIRAAKPDSRPRGGTRTPARRRLR